MTVVDLYTIQIIRDDSLPVDVWPPVPPLGAFAEAEENITDLLPSGYRAQIRRWNNPGEEHDE